MEVLGLTIFISFALGVLFAAMFFFSQRDTRRGIEQDALLPGVIAASQLNFWQMNGKFLEWITFGWFKNEGVDFLSFGRLRPLHTNAAIFAFVGNMMSPASITPPSGSARCGWRRTSSPI